MTFFGFFFQIFSENLDGGLSELGGCQSYLRVCIFGLRLRMPKLFLFKRSDDFFGSFLLIYFRLCYCLVNFPPILVSDFFVLDFFLFKKISLFQFHRLSFFEFFLDLAAFLFCMASVEFHVQFKLVYLLESICWMFILRFNHWSR